MASKRKMAKRRVHYKSAAHWIGQPVCVVLHDGSYYIGIVDRVENGELILSGTKGEGTMGTSPHHLEKARISGFLGSLFGGGGFPFAGNPAGTGTGAGAAAAPASGGIGNFMGLWKTMWPGIRLGFGMMKMIIPLFGMFKR
ncbi:hypothetical protein [Paenibacillus abyssi]|uniref:Uncharacterized protein n=1 Tax=Paenibacillus abyssi TaxID=1340531 RepID=A0A917D1M1_9BACL|nr:hypothetical protein [Paenibacillus abyssi]GGG03253.1 hypothetical protein GCM10010916_20420 [Paenibacillus abyssi]